MVLGSGQHNLQLGHFQYSLCRVVLMVRAGNANLRQYLLFQYSLCRVVLMV